MSRSLHTQKLRLRAQRRVLRPHSKRRDEAHYLTGRQQQDVVLFPLPKIEVCPIPPNFCHPLTVQEIRDFLVILGPVSYYSLQKIVLRSDPVRTSLVLGAYRLPGIIDIFAVPSSGWQLSFIPTSEELGVLRRYAQVELDQFRGETRIVWTAAQRKAFYLWEVLAHELSHHHLQRKHNQLQRPVCRAWEHERAATLLTQRLQHLHG